MILYLFTSSYPSFLWLDPMPAAVWSVWPLTKFTCTRLSSDPLCPCYTPLISCSRASLLFCFQNDFLKVRLHGVVSGQVECGWSDRRQSGTRSRRTPGDNYFPFSSTAGKSWETVTGMIFRCLIQCGRHVHIGFLYFPLLATVLWDCIL